MLASLAADGDVTVMSRRQGLKPLAVIVWVVIDTTTIRLITTYLLVMWPILTLNSGL